MKENDTPEESEGAATQMMKKKRPKSKRKELRLRSRRTPASPENNANGKSKDKQTKATSPVTRPQQRSEAAKRNLVEKQRKRHHTTTDQEAHTNNRFLRALSGQIAVPGTETPHDKKMSGVDDDDDNEDADTTTSLLNKKDAVVSINSAKGIIVTPATIQSGWFQRHSSSQAARQWTDQLKQQELAGMFVGEERKHILRLKHNTLDRLEERLNREFSKIPQRKRNANATQSDFLPEEKRKHKDRSLMEELLSPNPRSLEATEIIGDETTNDPASSPATKKSHDVQTKSNQDHNPHKLAMLELFVDRLVLDDHPSFALADRLAAQLRALYTAYARMQQLRPWQLALQRLDEVFTLSAGRLAMVSGSTSTAISADLPRRQAIEEVNQLLTDLEALSQLHNQLLGKTSELRDAGTRAGSVILLRVKQRQRRQPIDLSRVEAVLELLEADADNQQDENTKHNELQLSTEKLSERLSTISATSVQALQTVLQLESMGDGSHSNDASFWSPRFYIVLRVNGKIACTTKTRQWSRGETRFCEKLCFTLPFFPTSVCAEVYERRRFFRDELLSTNAVPVVVPGQNVSKLVPIRPHLSCWEDDNTDHLVPAASLTPSDEWYQFSCTTPIARSQWHLSFHNSPLFARSSRRTQGRLHLRASWVGDNTSSITQSRSSGTAYLPPKRPETAGGIQISLSAVQIVGKSTKRDSIHLSQYLCDSGFSSERDFLRLVDPKHVLIDPNDPDNVAIRRLQVYYAQQQQEAKAVKLGGREVFRTSNMSGPLAESGRGLTKRNRLLRLRDREFASRHGTSCCHAIASHESGKVEPPRWIPQHVVFDEPLPLLEHELLADERLLRLLRPELHAFDRRLLSEEAERADSSIVERHRVRQLIKLQDFRERVRQTQIVSSYNTDSNNQETRAGRSKPLAAIVQEKPLPLFPGTFEFPALKEFLAPRRRLRPRPKASAAVPTTQAAAHWPTTCTLYVQVQKAVNIPVRIKPPRNAAEAEEIATTGRRRRDTLHRTAKTPRMMAMPEANSNASDDVVETPRGGSTLEYESNVFVQISFQGKTRQTSCATVMGAVSKGDNGVGAHPMWMETISLPFHPPQDDWSPEGIESTQDIIRFNLFDQVTRPASSAAVDEDRQEGEERLGAQTRAIHRENCFLGSLEVPFLTLYRAGRLESTLRCEMPVEHLGYANLQVGSRHGATSSAAKTSTGPPSVASSDGEDGSPRQRRTRGISLSGPSQKRSSGSSRQPTSPRSPEASDIEGDDDDIEGLDVKQRSREATYLKVTLLLDPVLPMANLAPDHDEKEARISGGGNAQDNLLLAHAQRWATAARSSAPVSAARHRNYSVFVRNLSHGATFLPRFLRAQAPPPEIPSSLSAIVRYVSLIPFLNDWLAFDGDKDVWSTTEEFLKMGAGDHEEHAVLLANYFMWYDRHHRKKDKDQKPTWIYLVLGLAIPEGNIVYVLRRGVLWNASTGIGYAVSDPHCPLRDVSLVVSSKNIFANVQPLINSSGKRVGGSYELNWEIEKNPKCWKPFFTAKNISLPPSVQRREIKYSDTPPEFVEQVERELREALKLAVRRWRSTHFATSFNEAAGLQLREHLIVLEREANGQQSNLEASTLPSASFNNAQVSPRSNTRLKQKLKLKLALPTRRVHPGSSVLRELQRSKEVCGLPLHVSFTDIPRVLEVVENTVRIQSLRQCYGTIFFPGRLH
ncbi:unnamed protein product [Phytophthora lilii]|uniref:Unnamed protein product n=1 Tax=Phytophthora lilii TaxID=2077276 RepID=A0A9W6U602_9STRA|nr:unnamed protein product [Phytophthora lilii]